jgi:hypothetical protein
MGLFRGLPVPPEGSSVMSEQPGLKSVPVGMSPLGQYFVGRLLMLRERLSYEQWSSFERSADVICDSFLKRMPVARQSKPLVQRQSAIHPMVEQRSVGKLMSGPKPPEAGAQRARLYISLTAGHHNSRMQLTLDDIHRRQ